MEPGTWIALGALGVTLGSVIISRRGQSENLSLAQIVAANRALSERVDRVEEELEDTHAALKECERREERAARRDSDRLRRIIRLEDALTAAGVPLPAEH